MALNPCHGLHSWRQSPGICPGEGVQAAWAGGTHVVFSSRLRKVWMTRGTSDLTMYR